MEIAVEFITSCKGVRCNSANQDMNTTTRVQTVHPIATQNSTSGLLNAGPGPRRPKGTLADIVRIPGFGAYDRPQV